MKRLKIAITFDSKKRFDTTGIYCLRALKKRHDVYHYQPEEISQIDPEGYDVFINIDDGLKYGFPEHLKPSIFWAIDSHTNFNRILDRAHSFTYVFSAQKDGAERLRKNGINARWCPLACDPEIHKKYFLPKIFNISFVGNFGKYRWYSLKRNDLMRERNRLIFLLMRKYNLFTGRFYFHEMALVYSLSKIVFNRSMKNDINMRVFEAMSCGSLLITNRVGNGQDLLFKHGIHFVEYKSDRELFDYIDYYLKNDSEREQIASEGMKLVQSKHTYEKRMDYMLSFLFPWSEGRFDFSGVKFRGDYWVYEKEALLQFCKNMGKGANVGCGHRKISEKAIGIDIDKNSAADIICPGDILPFRNGELDYVVSCHALEHFDDTGRVLSEWKRVVRRGGVIGIVVPDDRIIDTLSLNPDHKKAFTPEIMIEEVERVGGLKIEVLQEIVDAWSFGCILRKISD